MVFRIILGIIALLVVFILPAAVAVKKAIKEDNKSYEIESRYKTSVKKRHTHLRNTIVAITIGIAICSAVIVFPLLEMQKRRNDEARFHQAIRNSDCFSRIEYDSDTDRLYLTFRESDTTYVYAEIPGKLYHELYRSDNLGEFYNERIKGQYPSMRLD